MKITNRRKMYIIIVLVVVLLSIYPAFLIFSKRKGLSILGDSTEGCVPYNIFISKGERNFSVDIAWSTKAECVGFVQYGRNRDNLDMVVVDTVNMKKSKNHKVTIEQLLTTELYYFLINSQEQAYGSNGVPLEFVLENL
ncbi:MAG: hypothetical protein WCY00_02295 [Candidatus Dojkabacteria bacterium]|jgi:hypothetical protein